MSTNVRNGKVIVALILSMTVGASLLLWLETPGPAPGWSAASPLMAQQGDPVERLTIEYLPGDDGSAAGAEFDGTIWPDGRWDWQARGANLRLALVSGASGGLGKNQGLTLLMILRQLSQLRGLDLSKVSLAMAEPSSGSPVPQVLSDVRELLTRKGILQN